MTNSDIFKLAHKKTKLAKVKAALQGVEFSYQVTFSFYLKDTINAQPMKYKILTNVVEQKQVNIECAMVGDYVKLSKIDKLGNFVNSALFPILLFVPYFIYLAIMAHDYF